ncbi:MAG TPA: hypothetical protein VLX28_24685 [Thermoanaerobaculia bacterium]|nr:hypothetical protein [Thermoanaerobaculia bacterium]
MSKGIQSNPPARIEYVRLPDDMPAQGAMASFDASGKPDADGTVRIMSYGVQFVWARFSAPVKAGQVATMVVSNLVSRVDGKLVTVACVMDGAATEWDMSTNLPVFGDAVVELVAVERGMGSGRIVCRNTYDADLYIAAGFAAPMAVPGMPPS